MLCHTCPGPGRMGGLRVKCAECGTETGGAAQVCVVCGAPAAWGPSPLAGGPGASPAGAPSGSTRFSITRLRPGYEMEQVDAFLDAVRDTFLGVRQPPLTADEIRDKQFATTRLRSGYDEEEVDAFLGEAEARLRVTCIECEAGMGTAPRCRRCELPVPEPPRDEAPEARPVNKKAAKRYKAFLGWTVGVLLNIIALWMAISFVAIAVTEGSPAQEGPNYIPPWVCAFIVIVLSIVPGFSVFILVRRRRERRAVAPDSPELLPESLD